jgi:hypothetical protein
MPTFATPTPISATIELAAGDVRIVASDRTDTVVEVRPRDESDDHDVRAAGLTRVEFADGKLTVKAPKPLQMYFAGRSGTVHVTVSVPSGSDLRGSTLDGELRCEGSLGACTFRTYDGDITLHDAQTVRLTTTNGRITADRVAGDVHITGSGDIELTEVGGSAWVRNLNGPSWIGDAAGPVRVHSAHGDILIDRAGPGVVARTAHGSVRLGDVAQGSAVLQTASGEIEVGVRKGTAAWLDVKSLSGQVRNGLEESGGPGTTERTVQIRARTLDGDIVIRRSGSFTAD